MTLAMAPAVYEISTAVVKIQDKDLIMPQKEMIIETLKNAFIDMFNVFGGNIDEDDDKYSYIDGDWRALQQDIVNHPEDQGSFCKRLYEDLGDGDQRNVVSQITWFAIHVVAGLDRVKEV